MQYILHVGISSCGIVWLTFLTEMFLGRVFDFRNQALDYAFFGPTFSVPILGGLVLGYVLGGRLPRLSARLLFVIPLLFAAYEIWNWITYSESSTTILISLKDNFLGGNCGASECLEELIVSAPLFSSIAYSIGSEFAAFRNRLRHVRN